MPAGGVLEDETSTVLAWLVHVVHKAVRIIPPVNTGRTFFSNNFIVVSSV
jgi:hypothetical protein